MQVENISNLEALAFVGGVIVFAFLFLRLIPGGKVTRKREQFSDEEITSYDKALPKYFLAAALALVTGGLHTVVKNLPGFWQWLWEAGYGGHVFRDLSNSHIIIVGGGTVLLTGITWYVLPRIVGRPLYSNTLAGASLALTVAGVFGFYLAWLILGLVEGQMVRLGWDYLAAKAALGKWHSIPTAASATIMGFGYWTYVLNVFLTVFVARKVINKPTGYLAKFALVSAGALFVGTVQGVIQVMPDNADWIRAAGKFGQYVDPISHAHVNLVTGMMVSLALFLIYFAPRMSGRRVSRAAVETVFWLLVPGSVIFYLSFLLIGLILGGSSLSTELPVGLTAFISQYRPALLALAGMLMLAGFWAYFIVLWRAFGQLSWRNQIKKATPASFWLVSSIALIIGTFQGLLQVIPATAAFLTAAEEIPNIHAQLNMVGGVMLALIGTVYYLLPEVVSQPLSGRLKRQSLWGIAGGIGAYYLVILLSGLVRFAYMRGGLSVVESAARLGWVVPLLAMVTAVPMLLGYLSFALAIWRATERYRSAWWSELSRIPQRTNGQAAPWRGRLPLAHVLGVETMSAMLGFPGLGWILHGQPFWGLPLILCGPALAWAVIPLLFSPYGDGPLRAWGSSVLIIYLITSTILSVGGLWVVSRRTSGAHSKT